MPSTGIDRRTGKVLTGLDHVRQSVEVILTTALGSRVLRRTFGSEVPGLLGVQNLTPAALLRFKAAVILCIETWEPRLRVSQVLYPASQNTADDLRAGHMGLAIRCIYRPNALAGDVTSDLETIYL